MSDCPPGFRVNFNINTKNLETFVLRLGESILCLLYYILISDRLDCKVVGASFNAMQHVQ